MNMMNLNPRQRRSHAPFAPFAALFLLAASTCLADGLIIVHDQHLIAPRPMPPPHPAPPPPSWPTPTRHHVFAPLEVAFHHVNVRIRDQVAVTEVDQEFYNPNDRQLEGTYIFPIPKGAQIDRFSMEVGGKQVQAELLAADKARQIYEDIVRQLRDPALLEYVGRDVFKVRIFPIEPRSRKRVKLAYTQLLKADAGLISYLYPLNTEKFSAKPIQTVSLKLEVETKRPLKSIYSPSHNVDIQRRGNTQATVGFETKDARPDTDFQLFFATEAEDIGMNLLTYKQGGEDGYFLLLASPGFETKGQKSIPKDLMFVLDTSGSMAGKKLEQAKKALLFCVENLNDDDRFDITRFSTDIESLFNQLTQARPESRRRATDFIQGLKPTGGTAIDDALRQALKARPQHAERPYTVIFLTDGLPTVGVTDIDRIVAGVKDAGHGNTRVFCFGIGHDVNTHLLDRITETTRAYSQYVLPEEDLEVKVSTFFARIREPALENLRLAFPSEVRVTKLYPAPLPDLFKGEQLVVVGRYAGAAGGAITLEGALNGAARKFVEDARFPAEASEHDFIPRLWATRRIGYLLDEIRLRGESAELRDEVTELARRHGIVTPYTAFLIHEDEARRQVPLAMQSIRTLEEDKLAYSTTRRAYDGFKREVSGQGAVAAARYGLVQKSANQVTEALTLGRVEAERGLAAAAPLSAAAPPTVSPAPAAPSSPVVARGGLAAAKPAAAAPAQVTRQVVESTQQSRFIGGRTFFQNGNQWIDANVQKLAQGSKVRVQFNSTEYFNLVAREPRVRPWLALGQNVQFTLGSTIYEVYE
jgi:Ca-activated chloride channel family protein